MIKELDGLRVKHRGSQARYWPPAGGLTRYRRADTAAVVHDLILVTRNVRHVEHVPRLYLENWFE